MPIPTFPLADRAETSEAVEADKELDDARVTAWALEFVGPATEEDTEVVGVAFGGPSVLSKVCIEVMVV